MVDKQAQWQDLSEFLNKWFFSPDLEALSVTLAVAVSHFIPDDDPVWLMVAGPPGTGKTAVCIGASTTFPHCFEIGDLTPNTFLSAFGKEKNQGLLHRVGAHGIFLFKDFTTVLSKRYDSLKEIASQLREIHDGRFTKETGGWTPPQWHGKVTVIAAVTEIIDQSWTLLQEMGDRFVIVRWPRKDGIETAKMAHKQISHRKEIEDGLRRRVNEFIDPETVIPAQSIEDPSVYGLPELAELTVRLRGRISHDLYGRRDVIHAFQPEGATRIMKAMSQIIRAHASLWGREITDADVAIGKRVALDSVITSRRLTFDALSGTEYQSVKELVKTTRMAEGGVKWALKDLAALGVVRQDNVTEEWMLSDGFAELKEKAKLG